VILAAALLLHNITVIDGTGAPPAPHRDVLIRNERIVRIAKHVDAHDARVLDCTGKFLIPGLIDMHAHLLAHPWDEKGNLRPRWKREEVFELLQSLLRYGVTTVRDPGSETEAAVKLRDMHPPGPRIFTAGRIINASDFDPEPFAPVHNADEVRREIDWQARAGVDVIKIYASMPPDLVKVTIEEAHKHHLPIIGHLQRTTWTEAAKLGIDGVEHPAPWSPDVHDLFGRVTWLEHLDDEKVDEMIRALVAHHVVVDPTLIAIATKFDPSWKKNPDNALAPKAYANGWPSGDFVRDWTDEQHAEAVRAWPKLLALTKKMYDAGVTMTVGTDTPTPWIVPGVSVHDEMRLLRDAGIPPLAIIKMATFNAAKALHREREFGSVREGLIADLVVLDRDPLADIANTRSIAMVIQGGR